MEAINREDTAWELADEFANGKCDPRELIREINTMSVAELRALQREMRKVERHLWWKRRYMPWQQ